MSAIVISSTSSAQQHDARDRLEIVSLATGTKSLPVSALPKCKGLILHDCHAEILALRGFNYWLFCEMKRVLTVDQYDSPWVQLCTPSNDASSCHRPFRLKPGVEISLFSTEAPCGDASMELLMATAQAAGQDISPWPTPSLDTESAPSLSQPALPPPGRGFFSQLGALRRKPARADAEISMSKSCSDKLMLKQFTSLLSFPVDSLIEKNDQAFLTRMIVYEDQHDEVGNERALGGRGRLKDTFDSLKREERRCVRFFQVKKLPKGFRRFQFDKVAIAGEKRKATNVSAVWIAGGPGTEDGIVEVLVNGVKQGYRQFAEGHGKASILCRLKMTRKALGVTELLWERSILVSGLVVEDACTYSVLKAAPGRDGRRKLKQLVLDGLGGWPANSAEDDFEVAAIDLSSPFYLTTPPFVTVGYLLFIAVTQTFHPLSSFALTWLLNRVPPLPGII